MPIDIQQIETRKATLEAARTELKAHFIGIDSIIDDLLDYIQIWYLMPDLLSRPIIVNLWGMTGVGKTDLVRRLVKCLNFQDRFVEIELSNVDSTSWQSSVAAILGNHDLHDEKPAIVLFDEVQRFNTLNPDGTPIRSTKFTDFWELLSDGKLSKKTKENLDYYIQDYLFQQKDIKRRKERGEENVDESPSLELYEAEQLKSMLQLEQDISDIADMPRAKIIEQIQKAKRQKKVYEPVNHAKTLILVSGNLDEAFSMATQTSESDIDADIFHAFTKKVTMVDIKVALSRKFRPEQVARFGNIHLIYRSLCKVDFEQLIDSEVRRIQRGTLERFGITVAVDDSIRQLVYRNGVFPVQGVRPVFSSIVDILETNLSKFLFKALLAQQSQIAIAYDFEQSEIIAQISGGDRPSETQRIPFVGRIDKIRESNLQDTIANISVHEAGHAIAYMVLFGLAPLQLKSRLANSYAGGFTFPHQIHETRESLLNKIKIYLAGGLAEEVIFGKALASIGRSHDRTQATVLAMDYIRKYGFNDAFQANYTLDDGYAMDKAKTDADVEKMIAALLGETERLLQQHKSLLQDLSLKLAASGSMDAATVAAVGRANGLAVAEKEEGFLHIAPYHEHLGGEAGGSSPC